MASLAGRRVAGLDTALLLGPGLYGPLVASLPPGRGCMGLYAGPMGPPGWNVLRLSRCHPPPPPMGGLERVPGGVPGAGGYVLTHGTIIIQ